MVKTVFNWMMITFRPTFDEFKKFNDENILQDVLKWAKKSCTIYLLSFESAGKEEPNHFHLFCEFKTNKRLDKLKESFYKIFKKMEFENKSAAFHYQIITTKHYYNYYLGYCLKENHDKFGTYPKDTDTYLNYFKEVEKTNAIKKDKLRISKANFHLIITKYIEVNDLQVSSGSDVAKVLDKMLCEDYLLPKVFTSKNVNDYCDLTYSYYADKNKGESCTYYSELYERWRFDKYS